MNLIVKMIYNKDKNNNLLIARVTQKENEVNKVKQTIQKLKLEYEEVKNTSKSTFKLNVNQLI